MSRRTLGSAGVPRRIEARRLFRRARAFMRLRRRALRDAAFFAAFDVYTGAALLLLALGVAPAIVRAVPALHDALHELGGGDT